MWQATSIVAIALALPMLAAQAQQPTTLTSPAVPGYTMPSTQMWDMTSDGGGVCLSHLIPL